MRAPIGRAPKLIHAWQIWMSDNTAKIGAVCDERKELKVTIGDRAAVARELFELESQEVRDEYTAKAKARLAEETARHEADYIGEPSDDPAVQAE